MITPANDLLEGAEAIAEYLYGTPKRRRRIYDLHERGELPTFRLGRQVCARRSTLVEWIAAQEKGAVNDG